MEFYIFCMNKVEFFIWNCFVPEPWMSLREGLDSG